MLAFRYALSEFKAEGGVDGRANRYMENCQVLQDGMRKLGFKKFLDDTHEGYIITSYYNPSHPNYNFEEFYNRLNDKDQVIYPGKVSNADCFRIGNIGKLYPADMEHLLKCIEEVLGEMGHEALLHNFRPTYFLDKGETIEAWAKLIPEPWEDNRLINPSSGGQEGGGQFPLDRKKTNDKGGTQLHKVVISVKALHIDNYMSMKFYRNLVILFRLSETASDVLFRIEAFSEDQTCVTLKAETNVTVGCPLSRHLILRGKPIRCDGFKNYSFVIPSYQQKRIFSANREVSDKTVEYDLLKLGCPYSVQNNKAFKPGIDLYDGETFVKEVDVNYVLWEQHGRTGYKYSATMKEAGCISEAQSWEKMTKAMQVPSMESAWNKENYQSCFKESSNDPVAAANLDQPYEILNSSQAASHIVWYDVGTFVFTLKVIDPDFSLCNLTVEFGVQVYGTRSVMEEIPTFVVLGSSCLTIIILLLSGYYTAVLCSD
ncbi:hypothetical protein OS493_005399 [Desmophyllum pertusum]|uniref:CATSPERD/E C-terminal domain-containing protein n=1 Tax=Desmophyllum pertusum TaxID=174260 RepID=A0A9X0CM76_9CNID|nr:hypothetical protein OS493_005399 [Desmophyllum pertusum]